MKPMPGDMHKHPGWLSAVGKSENFRRCLLVAASLIFTWTLIEFPAMINLVDYEFLESSGVFGDLRFHRVPDPELTHLEPPHAHYRGSSAMGGSFEGLYEIPPSAAGVYRWDLKYDRNGFRNDTDLEAADLAVVGDSMAEGMTVSSTEVVTSVLQRLQGKAVANLGQFGFGPQQELIVLERYALALRPKTIIWMFSEGTDLQDAIRYRQVAAHPPTRWNFFLQRSFTRLAVRQLLRLLGPGKPPGVKWSGLVPTSGGAVVQEYFGTVTQGPVETDQTAIDETVSTVARAQQLASAHGAVLIFVFIPDKFRVFRDFCQYPPESECRNWALNDLPQRLQKALRAVCPGIGYLDLTPSLIQGMKDGALSYYPDDVHWTPDGHRIAAAAIHRYLVAAESGDR